VEHGWLLHRDPPGDGLRRVFRPRGDRDRGARRVLSEPVAASAVERLFRAHFGRAVAALIRSVGDWDVAEDAVQDAFATALVRWPRDGVPRDPAAWVIAVARNRAIDRLRRERALHARVPELAALAPVGDESIAEVPVLTSVPDERLRLIFACCHPALAPEAQVALTLRLLGGLSTAEVARAFLLPEATMAQRLARAKAKIRAAAIPFRIPPDRALPARLEAVLDVVYLVFNEGYAASAGDAHIRRSLCTEAIRLAAVIAELMTDEPEALGLQALLLAHDARRDARVDAGGALVLLEDQDRGRWDADAIEQATRLAARALRLRPPGRYVLQAAIAVEHANAPTAADTPLGPHLRVLRPPGRTGARPGRRAQSRGGDRARRRRHRRVGPDRRARRRAGPLPLLPRRAR
jgi:RNA polymerase sigma-70 factor (ECF subfamily)